MAIKDVPTPHKSTATSSKLSSASSASFDDKIFFSFKEVLDKIKKKIPTVSPSQLLHYGALGKIEFFVAIPEGITVSEIVNNQKIVSFSYPSYLILSGDDCLKLDIQKNIQQSQFMDGYYRTAPVLQLAQHYSLNPNPSYPLYYLHAPFWLAFENEDVFDILITEKSLFVSRERLRLFLQAIDSEKMTKSRNEAPKFYGTYLHVDAEACNTSQLSNCGNDVMSTILQKGGNRDSAKPPKDPVREFPAKNLVVPSDIVHQRHVVVRKKKVIQITKDSGYKVAPSLIVGERLTIDNVSNESECIENRVDKSNAVLVTDGVNADVESHRNSVLDDKAISASDNNTLEKQVSPTLSHIYADGEVFLSTKQVCAMIGLSKSTICVKMQLNSKYYDPTFPTKFGLGDRARRFKKSDIEAWMASREIL